MSVGRLIELLDAHRKRYGGDAEVKILSVIPAPVDGGVDGVITGGGIKLADDESVQVVDSRESILYLVGGCLDGSCGRSLLAECTK